MNNATIFHVCRRAEWQEACKSGRYGGSSQDREDGFIHFSTAAQIEASVAKHRAGQTGLVLIAVDANPLGDALRWERSRGGALFPHLYGYLPLDAVLRTDDLPMGSDGSHRFPPLD